MQTVNPAFLILCLIGVVASAGVLGGWWLIECGRKVRDALKGWLTHWMDE